MAVNIESSAVESVIQESDNNIISSTTHFKLPEFWPEKLLSAQIEAIFRSNKITNY